MAGLGAEAGWALDPAAAVSFRLSASSDYAQMAGQHLSMDHIAAASPVK